jgi:hypothetical protein
MSELPAFSLGDVLDGLFRLEKRSPTLRGSVPLRVAQACVPLLQGNAFGLQVVLREPLPLLRGPLGFSLALDDEAASKLRARYAAGLAQALRLGWLVPDGAWHRFLREQALFLAPARRLGPKPVLQLFTGLFIQPDPGLGLRLLSVGNRRPRSFDLHETLYASGELATLGTSLPPVADGPIPLCLQLALTPMARRERRIVLTGELACLAVMPAAASFAVHSLAERPEVGRAHCAFYDASYFRHKEGSPTRRYRKQVRSSVRDVPSADAPTDATTDATNDVLGVLSPSDPTRSGVDLLPPAWRRYSPAQSEVILAGPTELELVGEDQFLSSAGPQPLTRSPQAPRLQHVLFRNLLDFHARFDGATVAIDYAAADLEAPARLLRGRFLQVYGQDFVDKHPGALLYLSKYFTGHPPGEPHFFVKPWAFTRTPPGCSLLVQGCAGDGYDILRGVIATDQFHATPAVFAVGRSESAISVPARTPLLRAYPLPRALLNATYRPLRRPPDR